MLFIITSNSDKLFIGVNVSKLLTYYVLRPTQPPTLLGMRNE